MGKIIAVANQKGGVGKTTTCVNLTCALKKRGRRVLLVDCDPQGNSTSGMGVDKTATPNCYDMLMNGAAAADCIRSTKYGDVLPANMNLSGLLRGARELRAAGIHHENCARRGAGRLRLHPH